MSMMSFGKRKHRLFLILFGKSDKINSLAAIQLRQKKEEIQMRRRRRKKKRTGKFNNRVLQTQIKKQINLKVVIVIIIIN